MELVLYLREMAASLHASLITDHVIDPCIPDHTKRKAGMEVWM